jgi:hypothetical protein
MPERTSGKVFVSYSEHDRNWAREFASVLRERGVDVWFDASELGPGESWSDAIADALRESRAMVLVLSAGALGSRWISFELGAAVADNKRIIPVLVNDVWMEDLPPVVSRYQVLRESSPQVAGERVAEVLSKLDAA